MNMRVSKNNNMLNVSFSYDVKLVDRIKTIPGRQYDQSTKSWNVPLYAIQNLIQEFGKRLEIDEDVDVNYKKPKYNFKHEISLIKNRQLQGFVKWGLKSLPEYFYQVPASSSGKYHPSYAQGEEGLVRHTIAAVRIANELFNCETIHDFSEIEKDIVLVSLLLHDGVKHGVEGSNHTVSTHPLEVVKYIEDKYWEIDEYDIPEDVFEVMESNKWDQISRCIKSHMGQWNTDFKSNEEILPKPSNNIEEFVHLCDYLASRKILEFNFEVK